MNQHDRENLRFILSLKTDKDWDEWRKTITQEDIDYAFELLDQYSKEVASGTFDLMVECELELLNGNYTEATQVIDTLLRK